MVGCFVQVEPVLQAMEDVLGSLTQTLDGRVYVAMGRGLWDFTAREIYEYADELAESKENQVKSPHLNSGQIRKTLHS